MKAVVAALLASACAPAVAGGPYLELGLWHAQTGANIAGEAAAKQYVAPADPPPADSAVPGPYGSLELGYTFSTSGGGTSIAFLHLSSLRTRRDKGANLVGLTHRFGGKD